MSRPSGPAVRPADDVERALDRRLVAGAIWTSLGCALVAGVIGALVGGTDALLGALWGIAAVGLNGVAAAWVSAQGATTSRGIGIGRVLIALPIRLLLLAGAVLLGVGPLGLPGKAVGLAVIAGEFAVMLVQSWMVLRGPTFVGPLERGVAA